MITLNVNGKDYQVEVQADATLLWVIRDELNLTGTKFSCGVGECGACTVLIDGKPERSCTLSAEDAVGAKIVTLEGVPETHPIKRAWIEEQVAQCGYCQTGFILQAAYLLDNSPNPDAREIIEAMDDLLCRCGTYNRIKKGVAKAVEIRQREGRSS